MRNRQRASGWRLKVPVPVHGTSTSTASTGSIAGKRASATTAARFVASMRPSPSNILSTRVRLRSAAITSDALRESSTALPPGAAHRSATTAPAGTAAYCVTSVAAGSCTKSNPCLNAPSSVSATPGPSCSESRSRGTSCVVTPAPSSIASSCSRTTPKGRTVMVASWLLAASSRSTSAAPHRSIQRATTQRGCEYCCASASIGSVGVGGSRASRSRSTRRSTALASLLAPMPWRRFVSSTVCAMAA